MSSISPQTFQYKNGDQVVIRSACLDDAPALIKHAETVLTEPNFAVTQADEFDFVEEQEREWIKRHLDSLGSIVLVAEVDGNIVGMLGFECGQRRRLAHRGTLAMSLLKEFRGRGIGSALMQALIEWGENNPNMEKLTLAVLATNKPAIALYGKFGFVEEGRRPREVKLGPRQYVDDILMYRFVDQSGQ